MWCSPYYQNLLNVHCNGLEIMQLKPLILVLNASISKALNAQEKIGEFMQSCFSGH